MPMIMKVFKSLFLPRVAEFIYIEGDNKRVCFLLSLLYALKQGWRETSQLTGTFLIPQFRNDSNESQIYLSYVKRNLLLHLISQ